MKPTLAYPGAVGVLFFLASIALDAGHIGEHSLWRAVLVAALSSAVVYGIGPKITGKAADSARRIPW